MASDDPDLKKKMTAYRATNRRRSQRDALWPDAASAVFPSAVGGWAKMPRTVPMIAALLDELGGKDKPGRLYIALWTYDYGDGFVEVPDPVHIAAEAGYISPRAERTFNERMKQLRELGFIRSSPIGSREFGFVLLLDPHRTVANIRYTKPGVIREDWWSIFAARCASVGIPMHPPTPPAVLLPPLPKA